MNFILYNVIFMKRNGGFVCMAVLLFVGLSITPAMGSMFRADTTRNTSILYESTEIEKPVTVEFFDCTGVATVKKVVQLSESEWKNLLEELREIRRSSTSAEESWNAQLFVLKEHNLISNDVTYESLNDRIMEKSKNMGIINAFNRVKTLPIINNSIFNAICGINFELSNGTTLVFGLNTFLNIVGFNIVSFHYGHTDEGIDTRGLFRRSNDPGEYVGFMFGFLGYWFGNRTGTGVYSDLIANGFTVITAWLPVPSST
ncbi:MAG: hypothetical protein JSW60_03215 [Thermoplasmatales archaeon]|nr:MAG: hypothetical protein JSW60_03215 [Thermoplasmatales archaeon]